MFAKGQSKNDNLSSANLANFQDIELSEKFIICSSHQQRHFDIINTHSIYVLYSDVNMTKPWFSIGFYRNHILWANLNYDHWYEIGQILKEETMSWINICTEFDSASNQLKTSINGGNITTNLDVSGLNPTPKLHIRLGVVDESYHGKIVQFYGNIGGINIITSKNDLQVLSQNICNVQEKEIYLSWSKMKWNLKGNNVHEKIIEDAKVCSMSKTINYRLPSSSLKKEEAVDECQKYGNAQIGGTESMTNISVSNMIAAYGIKFLDCECFWTPISDSEKEGTFVDEFTKEEINQINWAPAAPNGERLQNSVIIRTDKRDFEDSDNERPCCVSCKAQKATVFTMRGACKDSFLETEYYATMSDGHLMFFGSFVDIR